MDVRALGRSGDSLDAMDPLLPAEMDLMGEADKDARRKIQFSVPSPVPTQLDPRQVEMVSVRADSGGVEERDQTWVMSVLVNATFWSATFKCTLSALLFSNLFFFFFRKDLEVNFILTFKQVIFFFTLLRLYL